MCFHNPFLLVHRLAKEEISNIPQKTAADVFVTSEVVLLELKDLLGRNWYFLNFSVCVLYICVCVGVDVCS